MASLTIVIYNHNSFIIQATALHCLGDIAYKDIETYGRRSHLHYLWLLVPWELRHKWEQPYLSLFNLRSQDTKINRRIRRHFRNVNEIESKCCFRVLTNFVRDHNYEIFIEKTTISNCVWGIKKNDKKQNEADQIDLESCCSEEGVASSWTGAAPNFIFSSPGKRSKHHLLPS